tara:strand:+ start:1147 stop:2673 length:1527 start_codon:yes stop_codon:yes gene_type:complete
MSIFGTDGIRGIGHVGVVDDPLRYFQDERLFSKQLCGEIAYCASLIAAQGHVLIGWDRRPHNQKIAEHVIECLKGTRQFISVLGETTTPALQFMMLKKDAALGLMITASHNPSEDTGLKILFENGRKPTEGEQILIERQMFTPKKNPKIQSKVEILSHDNYISSVSDEFRKLADQGILSQSEILVDGSGGWLSTWLAEMISSTGIICHEVSKRAHPINFHCGAGDLSEGWLSWNDCRASEHSLLKSIKPSARGKILGFCFDGDGDRCYLICSDGAGVLIVGGDGFLRLFSSKCHESGDFVVALTIESALDVSQIFRSLGKGSLIETGVGDRWLQHALINQKGSLKVGAEPSGHVILEQRCGSKIGLWGDGVRTMLEFLRLIHRSGPEWMDSITNKSSKTISKSIYPSNRDLWSPSDYLGDLVTNTISNSLGIGAEKLNRIEIENEESLLLLKVYDKHEWSISIRNSGTEPKTRITIRTTDIESSTADEVMSQIIFNLEPKLKVGITSL